MNEVIRPSFGRSAHIGDLYDVRTEQLINGINVFTGSIPEDVLRIDNAATQDMEVMFSSSITKKLSSLGIEGEAKISLLCKFLPGISGSIEYINENKQFKEQVQCNYIQRIRTVYESINIVDSRLRNLYKKNIGDDGTHIIVGISWGANAIASLTFENGENEELSKLEGKVKADLSLPLLNISVGGEIQSKEQDFSYMKNLNFKIHADIRPNEQAPRNVHEALEIIYNMPKLIKKEGKGRQLEFHLLPLDMLKKHLEMQILNDKLFYQIEIASIKRIEQLFDDIENSRLELNDLKTLIQRNKQFTTDSDIKLVNDFTNEYEVGIAELQTSLQTTLKGIRACELEQYELDVLRGGFYKNPVASPNSVHKFVSNCETIQSRINLLKEMSDIGIKFVRTVDELASIKNSNRNKDVYLLSFSSVNSRNNTEWSENYRYFRNFYDQGKSNYTFAFIDYDISPEIWTAESLSPDPRISMIMNGKYIYKDLLQEVKKMESQCTVKCGVRMHNNSISNYKRRPIRFPCPNSFHEGRCSNEIREWICAKCRTPLEYGFDKMFYCICGFQSINEFNFKCCDDMHGDLYLPFNIDILNELVSNMREREEITIVVLGETGVGKSTWINAIAAYITYETAEEAIGPGSSLINLIPTEFSLVERIGDEIKETKISTGGDTKNECFKEGKSSTQSCRVYHFAHDDKLFRIIDTPGIGDTDGLEQDKKNIENIMFYADKYKTIHAFCILMKPNEARLTESFEYCFNELLTQFHKSAAENIVFCFTNTSGHGFNVSATLTPLETLLKKLEGKGIKINIKSTRISYAFDNMAYRYLCAKQGEYDIQFSADREDLYRKSYKISRDETVRLFKYIGTLVPHKASDSVSIFNARNTIFKLNGPLVNIGSAVQQTIDKIAARQELICLAGDNMDELRKILKQKITLIHWRIDSDVRECCAGCKTLRHYHGNERLQFLEVNPDACDRDPFTLYTYNRLKKDSNGNFTCEKCGPNYVYYKGTSWYSTYSEEKEEENETIASKIQEQKKTADDLRKQIKEEEKIKNELLAERDFIVKATASFAHFLKNNSITTYNDAAEKHLKKLIHKEEHMGINKSKLTGLKELLKKLQAEKKSLDDALKIDNKTKEGLESSVKSDITSDDILKLVYKLQDLRNYGNDIKEALKGGWQQNNRTSEEEYTSYYNGYAHLYNNQKTKKQEKSVFQKFTNFFGFGS